MPFSSIRPPLIALPGSGSLLCPFFPFSEPLRLMASFVREILGLRQARPSVSLNIEGRPAKSMHHNSYGRRKARIIVLVNRRALGCPAGRSLPTCRPGWPRIRDQVFRVIDDIGRVIEADVVRGHGADRVEIARVEMPDMFAEAIAIGVRQFRLRPILSAALFSANPGLVLYLIKVHSSLPPHRRSC